MNQVQKIVLALAMLHLLIAACFAAHMGDWGGNSRIMKSLRIYSSYTGAGNVYSFFAPAIGPETQVMYTLVYPDGSQTVTRLENDNHERNMRIETMYNFFGIDGAKNPMAHSCSSYMLTLHPDVIAIRFMALVRGMPDMKSYREGIRPRWEVYYSKDFKKRKDEKDQPR